MRKVGRHIAMVLALVAGSAMLNHENSAYARGPYSSTAQVMRAAERGDVNAQAHLGWMYSVGVGVPQNYVLAAKWYLCAAERGHGAAQFALGLLYNKGQGVQHDLVLAYMWLNLSAAQARGENRDFRVRIRDAIASKMTIAEIAVAQQIALDQAAVRGRRSSLRISP